MANINIQIYALKKNFDVQKAERFFKERRIPFQTVDLKKHMPGQWEIELFCRAAGSAYNLVDRKSVTVMSHPVAHTSDEGVIREYFAEHPEFMRLPIVRNGNKVTIGADEAEWKKWVESAG